MQNLDPNGEYTDEEVKEALSGASGSRDWAFRYERLNEHNDFVEEVDYVQSCTIDNNSLADIKRTAKFSILDTGNINYLKDRIKPYVRLTMPKDMEQSYPELMSSLKPSVWWRMDDPAQPLTANTATNNLADGLTYNTLATAYAAPVLQPVAGYIEPVQGTNRAELWVRYDVTSSAPVRFDVDYYTGSEANTTTAKVYFSSGTAASVSEMELLFTRTLNGGASFNATPDAFPRIGTYYFHFSGATARGQVSAKLKTATRAYDSSGNNNHGVMPQAFTSTTPIVKDGGKASTSTGQITIETGFNKELAPSINEGLSVSSWLKFGAANQYWDLYTEVYDSGEQIGDYKDFSFSIYVSSGSSTIDYSYTNVPTGDVYYATFTTDDLASDGKFHHVVASVSPNGFAFYLDGKKVNGTLTYSGSLTGNPKVFKTSWESVWAYSYSDGTTVWDDHSIFVDGALTDQNVSTLYKKGLIEIDNRKGYVEWPQGVFLLSSPTRTMVEGNTVVREIEAYDQLLALKEDSYVQRHTVRAGARYTDAVVEALQTSSVLTRVDLAANVWETNSGTGVTTVYNSTSTVTMTTGASNVNYVRPKSRDLTLEGMRWSFRVDPSSTADCTPTLKIESLHQDYAGYTKAEFGLRKFTSSGTAYIQFKAPGEGYYTTIEPWDAPSHKYLRLRVEDRTIFYERSSDAVDWIVMRQVGNTYPVASRALPTIYVTEGASGDATAMLTDVTLFSTALAEVNITTSTLTLPTAMEWEPGTSKLQVINDLLAAINYTSATYDENGVFVSKPYISPAERGSEFTYATDESSVITGDISQTVDLFKIPNKWVLVVSDPERQVLGGGLIIGEYTNEDPMSPTSTVSRGRTIVDYRTEQDAPDQATLDAKAARLAFEASQVYEKIVFNTGLMPIHTDSDVYDLIVDGLVVDNKYSETAWSMALDPGQPMAHEVRRITNV